MAPQPRPSRKGVAARLTAKVGPLPVWAWAAVILGAYLLWSRTRSASASTDTTATPDTSGDSGAQVPASGGGGPADNVSSDLLDRLDANTSSLDALTSQILSMPTPYSNFGDAPAAGTPASDTGQGTGPAATPTTTQPAPTPTSVGANAGHATQTQAGSLKWGGLTFTTKAAFDSWAKSHGTTTTRELSNHPQAKAIYSTLK